MLTAVAGGLVINVLSNDYQWTVVGAAAIAGSVGRLAAWLHRLPEEAPIVQPAMLTMMTASLSVAPGALVLTDPLSTWAAYVSAVLLAGALLIPKDTHFAARILAGVMLVGAGVVLLVIGWAVTSDDPPVGICMFGAGAAMVATSTGAVTSRPVFMTAACATLSGACLVYLCSVLLGSGWAVLIGGAAVYAVLCVAAALGIRSRSNVTSTVVVIAAAASIGVVPLLFDAVFEPAAGILVAAFVVISLTAEITLAEPGLLGSSALAVIGLALIAAAVVLAIQAHVVISFDVPLAVFGVVCLLYAVATFAGTPAHRAAASWWMRMTSASPAVGRAR
ncbi:hypothetical protein [Actinoplanes sp. URMC 104]|uniref:hypothetical protein n=1 Tax=Actinoplanes sp. URMC 104 TaxID=3423409 RepID=UPI003F1CE8E3